MPSDLPEQPSERELGSLVTGELKFAFLINLIHKTLKLATAFLKRIATTKKVRRQMLF